jgi:hypothetical protein
MTMIRRRPPIVSGVALAGAIALFFAVGPASWHRMPGGLLLPLLVAVASALASIGAGDLLLRLVRRIVAEPAEGRATSFLLIVGYPIFGTILFLVALVSTRAVVLVVPSLLLAVLGGVSIRRRAGEALPRVPYPAALAGGALLLIALVLSLLPAVSLDEVSYHLAIPDLWVSSGKAVELPLMSHSWFPLGTESADLPALALLGEEGGAIASHLLHLLVAVAMALQMAAWLGRASPATGWFGTVGILSTPALLLMAGWSGTDVPLAAVTTVLFVELDGFVRREGPAGGAAVAIAAGLLIKYTFVPIALALAGLAWILAPHRRWTLTKAAALGFVAGSVFFARNLQATGNPVAPFLSGETGGIERFRWAGGWAETLSSYLFDPRWIDDSLGFVLPGLAISSLVMLRLLESTWHRLTVIVFVAGALLLSAIGPAGRILIPFLLPPALIVLFSIGTVIPAGVRQRLLAAVLIAGASLQILVAALHLARLDPLPVLTGQVEDREWVSSLRRSQHLIEAANPFLPEEGRTLVLGVQELFWFRGDVRGGGNFDSPRIAEYLDAPPDELLDRLRGDGMTHLLLYENRISVGPPSSDRSTQQRSLTMSRDGALRLSQFLNQHTEIEASFEHGMLFRIRD